MLMSVCEKTMGRVSRKRIEKTKSDIIPFIDKRRQLNYDDKTEKKIGQETAIFFFFFISIGQAPNVLATRGH